MLAIHSTLPKAKYELIFHRVIKSDSSNRDPHIPLYNSGIVTSQRKENTTNFANSRTYYVCFVLPIFVSEHIDYFFKKRSF